MSTTDRAPNAGGYVDAQVAIGRSGTTVGRLGFGCGSIGGLFAVVGDEQAYRTLERAWDVGIRYFDVAPHYGAGLAEQRLGAFLRTKPRDAFTISTKVGRRLEPWDGRVPIDPEFFAEYLPNVRVRDYSADGAKRQLDASLERLGVGHIDIAYVHDPDEYADEALAGVIPALIDLREQGVLGAVGAGMNQWQVLDRFVVESDLDVVMLAGRYTLLDQSAARTFLPRCLERGVQVVAAGIFNSGILAKPGPGAHFDYAPASPEILVRALHLQALCAEFDVPLAAAAAQFPLRHPACASVVLGMRTEEQVSNCVDLVSRPIPAGLWQSLAGAGVELAEVGT